MEMSKDQNTKDVDDWLLHLCKSRSCMPREDSSFTGGQFQNHLQNELSGHGIRLDTVTHDKNVPELERYTCDHKDRRARSAFCMLPFDRLPNRMIIELMHMQPCNVCGSIVSSPQQMEHHQSSAAGELVTTVTSMRIAHDTHSR